MAIPDPRPVAASAPTADLQEASPLADFAEGRRLVGSRCATCGTVMIGARVVCSSCVGSDVALAALPAEGTLYSFTTLRVGADAPRTVGYVDLANGVRTFATVKGEGIEVDVAVELRTDGDDWWFVAKEEEAI